MATYNGKPMLMQSMPTSRKNIGMFNDVALVERAGVSEVSLLVAATITLQTPVLLPGGQMPCGKVAVASRTVELVRKKGCGHSWDIIGCREHTSTFGRHSTYEV